jgi:hypothetical protein
MSLYVGHTGSGIDVLITEDGVDTDLSTWAAPFTFSVLKPNGPDPIEVTWDAAVVLDEHGAPEQSPTRLHLRHTLASGDLDRPGRFAYFAQDATGLRSDVATFVVLSKFQRSP